jgi:hypothetical protein
MVARSWSQEQPVKILIRSPEWGKSYIIEGRDLLYHLIDQLADYRSCANERPFLVFQMAGKKTGANKKV